MTVNTLSNFDGINAKKILFSVDMLRHDIEKSIDKNNQAKLSQYLTSSKIASFMAAMFTQIPEEVNLLDPGAGIGTLSAAFLSRVLNDEVQPKRIKITTFEVDPFMVDGLRKTLSQYEDICNKRGIDFQYEIKEEDFIENSVRIIASEGSFFPMDNPHYNCAIMNPPYKKINNESKTKQLLRAVGMETPNLYSAFLWLVIRLLEPESEFVSIIPRSFCNGTYYRPFRLDLNKQAVINRIHVFESRNKAFQDGDVLQENIILHLTKTQIKREHSLITTNDSPDDEDLIIREVPYEQIIHPNDSDSFIRIVPNHISNHITEKMNNLATTLKDLGLNVSTGKVVDFRVKSILLNAPDEKRIPLIYPGNFQNGNILWPNYKLIKPQALSSKGVSNNLVVPSRYYVLVKRFSSKEEKKRITAALFDPSIYKVEFIGIENHINYFYSTYGEMSSELGRGLTLYLNSSFVDQYFRQFSGHTQINVSDLKSIKYPTKEQLISLGSKFRNEFPNQDDIDTIVSEELTLNDTATNDIISDPIKAKKRIKEALDILKELNVPKAQQNDRSALTLLALAKMNASTVWKNASSQLIGITEMMDYFLNNFGVKYAPNSRETVRRFTIHQFVQLGLVQENPDNPNRPINSPKTRYIIAPSALELIRSYGSENWKTNLQLFIESQPSLTRLQVMERSIPLIPVTLPNGNSLLLSSGGQNELIKKVIEEFCPRFTPGAKVIYIGDAGEKITQNEINYFNDLGIDIDTHGKMPDIVIDFSEKQWLVIIEAVTSHGPIDITRYNELSDLFSGCKYGLVFITAFETKRILNRYLSKIAWETEVWVAENPSHLIHFNGEKFLGPYLSDKDR
jgi:adenine-specific DNA-methyltransferase